MLIFGDDCRLDSNVKGRFDPGSHFSTLAVAAESAMGDVGCWGDQVADGEYTKGSGQVEWHGSQQLGYILSVLSKVIAEYLGDEFYSRNDRQFI